MNANTLRAMGPVAGDGWIGWVAVGTVVVVLVGAAALLIVLARRDATPERAYFRLYPTQDSLWGEPVSRRIDSARLVEGLGLELGLELGLGLGSGSGAGSADQAACLVADVPWGFPRRSSGAHASTGPSTVISIPADATPRLPFAAAGCGVRATAIPQPEAWVSSGQFHPLPPVVEVRPNPGWMLGISPAGNAVRLHAIPGSTVVVLAAAPAVPMVLGGMCWPQDAVSLVMPGAQEDSASWLSRCRSAWEDAWDPMTTRVVVIPVSQHTDVLADLGAKTGIGAEIVADVVVSIDITSGQGTLAHRNHREFFTLTHQASLAAR